MKKKAFPHLPLFLLICTLVLLVVIMILLYLFWSDLWPYSLDIPSPTGEYHLEQRYTDFLTLGYRGKTFLVYQNRRWFLDDIGPGSAGWLSDTDFFVGDRNHADLCRQYSVFDFLENS